MEFLFFIVILFVVASVFSSKKNNKNPPDTKDKKTTTFIEKKNPTVDKEKSKEIFEEFSKPKTQKTSQDEAKVSTVENKPQTIVPVIKPVIDEKEKKKAEKIIKYTKLIEKYRGFYEKGVISLEEFEERKTKYTEYMNSDD